MSMKVNTMSNHQNYSQFYRGTSISDTYSGGTSGKKQVVKYEFNTIDENGNKIMDKMSREETLSAMKEIRSRYGDDVIVEFSGDGMASLVESGKKANLDDIVKPDAQKQAAMDDAIVQMENTHRIVIPNIQTNEKLYNSLEGADENAVKAANGIIKNYFLPNNVGDISEKEWQDRIAFGMEEAKYIAENYLDEDHAGEFLSAMETIAKYGMNGSVDEKGNVTYDIKKGPLVGAPDDYVNRMDILKEKAPDLYDEINAFNYSLINRKSGEKFSAKFMELFKRAEKVLNSAPNAGGKTNIEEAAKEYTDWKDKMENTKLPTTFSNIKYNDLQNFFDSLKNQSSLSNAWMTESRNRFMMWLAVEKDENL